MKIWSVVTIDRVCMRHEVIRSFYPKRGVVGDSVFLCINTGCKTVIMK